MSKRTYISFLLIFIISCNTNKNVTNLQIEDNYSTAIEKLTLNLKNLYLTNFLAAKKKLAVIIFVNENGIQSRMGEFISNSIQLKIFDPKTFTLLERERIDSLLSEYEFNQTGLVSSIDSKKLGQLLGADLVLIGTVALNKTDNNKLYFIITGRIVNLESGEITAINSINIKSNDELFEKYNTKLAKNLVNIAGQYKLTIKNIVVDRKKADGRDWDVMSGPDIFLIVKTSLTDNIKSKIFTDKYEVQGEVLTSRIILGKNDYINIAVYDYDDMEKDLIGNIIISEQQIIDCLTAKTEKKVNVDQIKSLTYSIERED
ncbi:MAG: CsgG/HfaB family protein [Spirochaetota bacterium]